MFCGRCGKRVLDDMLFCPFCGTPIVIPDQEPDAPEAPAETPKAVEEPPRRSLFTEEEIRAREEALEAKKAEEEFVPLMFDFDAPEEESAPEELSETPAAEAPADEAPASEETVSAAEREPLSPRPEKPRTRAANTYVPVRDLDPKDLFMDEPEENKYTADFFDTDEYDSDEYDADEDDDYDFEDREEGGFFRRHVRGMVAMILFAVVLLVCVIWAFSTDGQNTLAKLNMAWTAQPYAKLGYEAFGAEDYTLSAKYYSRAIALEQDNYEYAHSAMVAEYQADNIDAATVMAKKCIELAPDNAEPYTELKKIYTGKELPWDVKELLAQGYARTGDESLNLTE